MATAKMTLLEIVQDTMNDMDSDEDMEPEMDDMDSDMSDTEMSDDEVIDLSGSDISDEDFSSVSIRLSEYFFILDPHFL